MDEVISHITTKKIPCYFISPHWDDAFLSAGSLISYLAPKTSVSVISVFTRVGEKPYSHAIQRFLHQVAFQNAKHFSHTFTSEFSAACHWLGVKSVNMGFIHGLWRKKEKNGFFARYFGHLLPELLYLYPWGRAGGGVTSRSDKGTVTEIQKKLLVLLPKKGDFIVFAPLGIGDDMDHLIIRDVCLTSFNTIIYWYDFPYKPMNDEKNLFLKNMNLSSATWHIGAEKKSLLQRYHVLWPYFLPFEEKIHCSEYYYYTKN